MLRKLTHKLKKRFDDKFYESVIHRYRLNEARERIKKNKKRDQAEDLKTMKIIKI